MKKFFLTLVVLVFGLTMNLQAQQDTSKTKKCHPKCHPKCTPKCHPKCTPKCHPKKDSTATCNPKKKMDEKEMKKNKCSPKKED